MKHVNLNKIYVKYLCYTYDTSFPKLSMKLDHKKNWLSSDVFNPQSTISSKYYCKCLVQLANEFNISSRTLFTLSRNNPNDFQPIISKIYRSIRTRKDLVGYIKLCLAIHGESLATIAKASNHGTNYFRTGLVNTEPGKSYRKLLARLANVMDTSKQRLAKFADLPKVSNISVGRKRINKFLICYAQAIGTDLNSLSKQAHVDLRRGILTGSAKKLMDCLKRASKLMYMPISTFKLVLSQDPVVYKSIQRIALHHVHDRQTLEQCLTCLATCNDTSLRKIGRKYHYPKDRIEVCLSKSYYQQIKDLLMKIRPALSVSDGYIQRAMKRSHIPKNTGENGAYDNLMALVRCFCLESHTTVTGMSKSAFNGNKDKLPELINKDSSTRNQDISNRISLIGLPASDVMEIINGDNHPLNELVKQIRLRVHDRKSLIDYLHAITFQRYTSFTHLSHLLGHQNSYIRSTLHSGYYEAIARLFKMLAGIMDIPLQYLMSALNRSKIRNAVNVKHSYYRRPTKLNKTSRQHIKERLYLIIRSHGIYPSHLSKKLHPNKSNCILVEHLMVCSRNTLIHEIALVLHYLHESPRLMRSALQRNKMGAYYPLLIQQYNHLKNIEYND